MVSAPAMFGKIIVIATLRPLTVPLGLIEVTGASLPKHCDKSFEGQTRVFAAPVNAVPVCVKFV